MQATSQSADSPPEDSYQHSSLRILGKGRLLDEFRPDTRMVRGGYAGKEWTTDPLGRSIVNPPVWHASTVTFPNVAALKQAAEVGGLYYGRFGTPTTWALEEAYSVLEGADNACVVCSGVAATSSTLMAFVKSGDHLLVSDGVYDPTRKFCDKVCLPLQCHSW
jgi:cystathionine beta-lyase